MNARRRAARVRVHRVRNGQVSARADHVAVEEPMELRVEVPTPDGAREHPVAVTMRTPGDDFELAVGFLLSEGLIGGPAAVAGVRYCKDVDPQEYNVVTVTVGDAADFDASGLARNFYVASSCGVCGKASLEAVEATGCGPVADDGFAIHESALRALPGKLRAAQRVFDRTGGIHAAGLFDAAGSVSLVREDVGRHNAVDKAVGAMALAGELPGAGLGLVVSGRTSFDVLQKAAMAGFPVVAAVGAPSSLAAAFARRFNMTLTGFTNRGGFNVYTGEERVLGVGGRGAAIGAAEAGRE